MERAQYQMAILLYYIIIMYTEVGCSESLLSLSDYCEDVE